VRTCGMTRQRYGRMEVRFESRHCLLDSAFETRADGCEQVGFGGAGRRPNVVTLTMPLGSKVRMIRNLSPRLFEGSDSSKPIL
jgi:hypothetical protein